MVTLGGEWQGGSYEFLTVVSHKGSGYISRVDNTDIEPGTNDSVWMRFAAAGESPEITRDAKGNIYVNGELLTSAFADAEAAAARLLATDTAVRAAEQERKNVEAQRANADTVRANEEKRRQLAEDGRIKNDSDRSNAENQRKERETLRINKETTRERNEAARNTAEQARASAEQQRKSAFNSLMREADVIRGAAETIAELQDEASKQKSMWKPGVGAGSAVLAYSDQTAAGDCSVANGSKAEQGHVDTTKDYYTLNYKPDGYAPDLRLILNYGDNSIKTFIVDRSTGYYLESGPSVGNVLKFEGVEGTYTVVRQGSTGSMLISYLDRSLPENLPEEGTITVYAGGAVGFASHIEGIGTVAMNEGEYAGGKYNKSRQGTIFSIGCGTSRNDRQNIIEVMSNGSVFIKGIGNYPSSLFASPLADVISQLLQRISDLEGRVSALDGIETTEPETPIVVNP